MELLLAGAASAAIGFVLHALPRGEALEANAQLLAAAREGKVSTITSLVDSGLAVDAPGEHGETALMVAAGAGKSAAVELLLSIGASMTLVATEDVPGTPGLVAGGTCVHAAAAAADGELILDTLLARNAAAVRVCDAQHNTPLHAAAAAGRASAVQACLARDPEPGPEPDQALVEANLERLEREEREVAEGKVRRASDIEGDVRSSSTSQGEEGEEEEEGFGAGLIRGGVLDEEAERERVDALFFRV